ncbi:hypothetical protein [Paenibacillus sp. JCM 10914]|uniref:hypothetical protein n=1 Tax=Paenibacillus sp. JCM 10914 TaxID=1236974 RepID=UPI0003CC6E5B|nr:hypothetical protein [Paenibacillus sp. JCM 10914]GAE10039.1 hypothetical protein JCM10914_6441 [Paenibacillus sp. JCM 10914]
MNDDLLREIRDLAVDNLTVNQDNGTAIGYLNDEITNVHNTVNHLSDQVDILNHSLYVTNQYLMWSVICLMLMTALAMFTVGYKITRK